MSGGFYLRGRTPSIHRDPQLRPGALSPGPDKIFTQDQADPEGAHPALGTSVGNYETDHLDLVEAHIHSGTLLCSLKPKVVPSVQTKNVIDGILKLCFVYLHSNYLHFISCNSI